MTTATLEQRIAELDTLGLMPAQREQEEARIMAIWKREQELKEAGMMDVGLGDFFEPTQKPDQPEWFPKDRKIDPEKRRHAYKLLTKKDKTLKLTVGEDNKGKPIVKEIQLRKIPMIDLMRLGKKVNIWISHIDYGLVEQIERGQMGVVSMVRLIMERAIADFDLENNTPSPLWWSIAEELEYHLGISADDLMLSDPDEIFDIVEKLVEINGYFFAKIYAKTPMSVVVSWIRGMITLLTEPLTAALRRAEAESNGGSHSGG